MVISPYFDPDEIKIDKGIVFKFINALLKHWSKNKRANYKSIATLHTYKLSLRLMSDENIEMIFKNFLIFANEMQEINGLMKMRNEIPTAGILTDIALSRLEKGDLFDRN